MTTTNGTAATWGSTLPVSFAVTTIVLSLALGGCESASTMLGGGNQPAVAVADAPVAKTVSVAIAPVLGVPEATSKQIVSQLTTGLDKTKFTVLTVPNQPADYTLRGYATAAKDSASKDKSAAKLSYFFDVMDKSGKKVNRIAGDEALTAAPGGKDIWTAVTPQIALSVANRTASAFTASITGSAPGPAIASAAGTTQPAGPAATAGNSPVKAAAAPSDVAAATASAGAATQTGSIDKPASLTTIVPSVTGAPGDGSQALSSALQKELSRNGVAQSDTASAQTYRVEGKVSVGPDKDGKQPIEISWNVKDPQGKKLGTVTQKNEIPQGSLDGAWGKTADAAAAAAAQGIIKLLPGQKTVQ